MVASPIRTPDQRLRVFVSSTLGELNPERQAVRGAVERLRLAPVMFELGARPHAPRALYRAYLAQSHVFIGIYWQRYGWVAPDETISGLEDEYRLAGDRPRLLYIKQPAPDREERLAALLKDFQDDDRASYKRFATPEELAELVENDLALLLTERFEAVVETPAETPRAAPTPLPLTRTLGRVGEIDLVLSSLRDSHRLVTLTGPGGVGKTRLALEAARALEHDYPDGVHFVPLSAVTDASLVSRSIVDRLGVRTEGAWTAFDALAEHLSGKRALLVLDNLEQIQGVELTVRQLLERIPGLAVLATSRRALRTAGEREINVPPLPLPDAAQTAEALLQQPAVQLFADRARDANPAFALSESSVRDIAAICRRLDSLPLAIELAAARSRLLPPAALLQRLDQSVDLLRSRAVDLPERQQTLRATLEWSHQLLSDKEQALLARLGVFAGGFTLDAAEAICDPDGSLDVLDSLTALLDNSLIRMEEDAALVEPRFRMLETVRAFAAERLEAGGEAAALAQRHLEWYAAFAREAFPFLCGPGQRTWAARVDPERANVRTAVATAFALDRPGAVVELVWDLAVFYEIRDAGDEPRAWIAEVVARQPDFDHLLRAKMLSVDTLVRAQVGDLTGAQEALDWSLDVFRANDEPFFAAVTLMVLSDVHFRLRGDTAEAVRRLAESTRLFEAVGHDWGVARTEIMLATLLWDSGDLDAAVQHLERSLQHSRLIDNEPQIARALSLLAMIERSRDPGAPRLDLLREACDIVVRGRYRSEASVCLDALAGLLLDGGKAGAAAEAVAVSDSVCSGLGLSRAPVVQAYVQALSTAARGEAADGPPALGAPPAHPDSVFDSVSKALASAPLR